jgi:hypothetical protein
MAIVTVYSFEVADDIRQDAFFLAKGKCTRETIAAMGPSARIIESTGEEVDDSLLTHSGRYREPENA